MPSILSENRRTIALAIPIIAGHIGQMLMGWVDTVMVGRIGVVPLGACGFANTLLSVPMVFGFGVLSAVSVHVSHSHGAGDTGRSAAGVRGGMAVALGLSVLVIAAVYAALGHIGLFGQPAEVNAAVGGYLIICGWSVVPVFLTCVTKNFCEALGRPWQPFWIMMAGVILNAVLNWILIFGNLGAPAMGLKGAAVATLIARLAVMVALFIYPLVSVRLKSSWPQSWLAPGLRSAVRRTLAVGLPTGALHFFEVSGFAFGSIMMGWIGVAALAAHQIAITCASTTFMVPLGLSQAVCVRVGHARGARRFERIRPIILGALVVAVLFMSVFVLVFTIGGRQIAGWFVADPEVVNLTARLLLMAGIFQIFDGIQAVSAGSLRGFEDTRIPMIMGILAYWCVALPSSWLAGFVMGFGAPGVWFGFVVGLAAAAAALLSRVLRQIARIHPSPQTGRPGSVPVP